MEAYPPEYVEHNLPLVVLSGLGERRGNGIAGPVLPRQESGTKIQASSPQCSGERSQHLLDEFLKLDGTNLAWNATALPSASGMLKYKMRAIGRVGTAAAKC